ncbi:MAG: methyl-accepting chemotaxis protein [Lachnospiraceae bacterium]|nr:methyl-accepting chemotaxis protein [Lachnospiraceae bacterium]
MAKNKNTKKKSTPNNVRRTKRLGVRAKLILFIVPVVAIAIMVVSLYMAATAKSALLDSSGQMMEQTVDEYVNLVDGELYAIISSAETLAKATAGCYKDVSVEDFAYMYKGVASTNDMILGCGVWFEPNVYDPEKKYYGPYWYKDGGDIVETWDYSNADYDYFSQEYYINAKTSSGAVITSPYYDDTSGLTMSSCSCPITDSSGKFIGCITVDIMMTTIQEEMASVKIGESGTVFLTSDDGVYVYHPGDENATKNGMTLMDSTEMGEYVNAILSSAKGNGDFKWEGDTRNLYWGTTNHAGWKVGLTMKHSEVVAPVMKMTRVSIILSILAMIITSVLIIWQANGIAKAMSAVSAFATELAKGNFTVRPLHIKRTDEIGDMAMSLNEMYKNNSGVIRNIGIGSTKVNTSSGSLSETSTDLLARFEEISAAMQRVNDAMTNTGAATEQVSASANEVNASVQRLADETRKTKEEAVAIEKKAAKIEKESRESSHHAMAIADQRGEELRVASEQAEVVKQIGTLADSIADIASQINLLSLNASIEAARAGEHGRGFAVVAGEINSLASETKAAVDEIQNTVSGIQAAFEALNKSAMELLAFVKDTAAPDYENFVGVAQEYGEDAKSFGALSDQISEMVGYISDSMEQVNAAVASIAESATETATSSSEVTETIGEVAEMVEDVNGMANDQQSVAENLDEIVNMFKLASEDEIAQFDESMNE